MSDLQTPVNRRRDDDNGENDDDGNLMTTVDNDSKKPHSSGTREPQPKTNLHSKENTDKGQGDKKKTFKEYHPNDTERRTLMPNVATFTSAFEDSFRMGSLDSMVLYSILVELWFEECLACIMNLNRKTLTASPWLDHSNDEKTTLPKSN